MDITERAKDPASTVGGVSFYFFDFDDNIMFLSTPIYLYNTLTSQAEPVSTGQFATIYPLLGKPGPYENYSREYAGMYRNFRDIPPAELQPGQKQYFVEDIEKAIDSDALWQAPSWELFVYACAKQRPVSIVTARGHSPETLQAGIRVLVSRGLIAQEPNYHTIMPVGNDDVRINVLGDVQLQLTTPLLKRIAITKSVDMAVQQYGIDAELRFGMSDDDPQNVSLITRAMCDSKRRYTDKRFFVINTHADEKVKVEVFPVDFPVARQPDLKSSEPI